MIKFGSSFEWAFRRALFSLLLLLVYLLIGSLLLSTVGHLEQSRLVAEACRDQREVQKGMRLDFERNELLNTLWAESLASRSESDWSLVANAKLDAYERLLFSASRTASACPSLPGRSSTHQWELASTFRSLLLLVTTAGGGPLTEQPPEQLGPATKVLAGLLALVGIPLLLTHLEHSVTALSALIEANFTESPRWGLALVVISGFVTAALAVDIVLVEKEEGELQRSFLDQLYTVLLAFFTISGAQLRPLPLPLLLPLCLCLCTLSGCLLAALLTGLQRWLAPHEFAFANGFCGQIEKAVSGVRLDQQRNSDQLPPKVKEASRQWKSAEVPVLRFNIGKTDEDDDDDGVDDLLLMNDMTEPNTTANHFGLVGHHHRGNIDTIEEEGELNSQGEPREE